MNNGMMGCKVFSATKHAERELVGDRLTAWLRENPQVEVISHEVRQSSDNAYHCFSITVFFTEVKSS